MVTRKDLFQDDIECEREKKRRKEESDKAWEKQKAEWLKKDILSAQTLLDGKLGKIIKEANREGIRCLKIDQFHTWKPCEYYDGWTEYYDHEALNFDPKPDYKPTKILCRILRKAGFKATTLSEKEEDYEYVITADGYDRGDFIGYSIKYSIVIDWSSE